MRDSWRQRAHRIITATMYLFAHSRSSRIAVRSRGLVQVALALGYMTHVRRVGSLPPGIAQFLGEDSLAVSSHAQKPSQLLEIRLYYRAGRLLSSPLEVSREVPAMAD